MDQGGRGQTSAPIGLGLRYRNTVMDQAGRAVP
jgi:hypothetical protein